MWIIIKADSFGTICRFVIIVKNMRYGQFSLP